MYRTEVSRDGNMWIVNGLALPSNQGKIHHIIVNEFSSCLIIRRPLWSRCRSSTKIKCCFSSSSISAARFEQQASVFFFLCDCHSSSCSELLPTMGLVLIRSETARSEKRQDRQYRDQKAC